jgi:hypothetical protein
MTPSIYDQFLRVVTSSVTELIDISVTLLTRIPEVLGSNFAWDISYPD